MKGSIKLIEFPDLTKFKLPEYWD